jgi:hypothetical protein
MTFHRYPRFNLRADSERTGGMLHELPRRPSRERVGDSGQLVPIGRYVNITVSHDIIRDLACDHTEGLEVSWHELILPPPFKPTVSVNHEWPVPETLRLTFITDAIPAKSAVEDFLRETAAVRPKRLLGGFAHS